MTTAPKSLPVLREIEPGKMFHPTVDERPSEIAAVSGAGLWLVERDLNILWMNDVMEGIYGPLHEKGDARCFNVFRGQLAKCPNCLPAKAFESRHIVSGFISRITPDGVHRYYHVIEAPLFDEKNEVSRVLEIVLDVTEKARLEQILKESEAEYRALFEHAGTAVAVVDENGLIVRANQPFEELSGYSRSEIEKSCPYERFVHPKDRSRLQAPKNGAEISPRAYEFSFLNRWGGERFVHVTTSRLPHSRNRIYSLIDLTEKRTLEQEIRSKDQFLTNILHHSVDAIVALDPDALVRSWNRGAELMFEYKTKEIVGKPFSTLLSHDFLRSKELDFISAQFQKEGFVRNILLKAVTKGGRPLTVNMTRTAILGPEQQEIGSSAIIRDVTEQRRLEQRTVQQEKMFALGELATSLAHEIKNPLNSMVINTEVLKGHLTGLPASQQAALNRYLEIVLSEVQRLNKAMEQVLSYAKPMGGTYEKVDLKGIVSHVIQFLSPQAARQRIKLKYRMEEDLPPIEGVPDHLIQIFINLLLNSFQAMPKGGTVTLIGVKGKLSTVVVSVTDTGGGIPRRHYKRVFDLYFSTKEKGSGLGLPLVKRLVTAHGGTITFKSKVRHGTSFTITFPAS